MQDLELDESMSGAGRRGLDSVLGVKRFTKLTVWYDTVWWARGTARFMGKINA